MNFLANVCAALHESAGRVVLQEIREGRFVPATGGDLLAEMQHARLFLRQAGLGRGDRCALLAANGMRWVALDLAIMAEGAMAVPLYPRQAPAELVEMMKDCSPRLVCYGDSTLRDGILGVWPEAPCAVLFDEIFASAGPAAAQDPLPEWEEDHPVAILYTSGTSGEPKGVVLSAGGVRHILSCTAARLDALTKDLGPEPERVFHYAPFCFAASWILLLSCLSRNSTLSLATDFSRLAEDMRLAAPQYFSNVPLMLERMRSRIEEQVRQRGGVIERLYQEARAAWFEQHNGGAASRGRWSGRFYLGLARALLFPKIRQGLGPNLKALICGSAALAPETQLFFMMLGVPVLQVYGLTETTAICTMDHPAHVQPGRVGPAIQGVEMKLGERDEILVRGPNLFLGYWNRRQATEEAMRGGWFHTGDQGEVNADGYWRITGRIKNVLVLASGHNVAPEPIEEMLHRALPGAQQVVVMGAGRSFLTALVTGPLSHEQVQQALDQINPRLPHYKRVHGFHVSSEPLSVERGLLTAMGKLKRDAIAAAYRQPMEALYAERSA